MKYLGTVQNDNGKLKMPDTFVDDSRAATYEAIDLDGDILLVASPLDRTRLSRIEELAGQSIADHRKSLEGLAK